MFNYNENDKMQTNQFCYLKSQEQQTINIKMDECMYVAYGIENDLTGDTVKSDFRSVGAGAWQNKFL